MTLDIKDAKKLRGDGNAVELEKCAGDKVSKQNANLCEGGYVYVLGTNGILYTECIETRRLNIEYKQQAPVISLLHHYQV